MILSGTVIALVILEIVLRVIGLSFEDSLDAVMVDSRVGWINQPNQWKLVCNDILPDCVRTRTNNQSLREDYDTSFDNVAGTNRLLVLGDSQTAADLVENNSTFPNVLEELLNEDSEGTSYEVLNGGVRGYSPVQEWLWFRELGIQYQPGITILGFYVGNDLFDMQEGGPKPYFELISDDIIVLKNYPVQANTGELNSTREEGTLGSLKRIVRPSYVYQAVKFVASSSVLANPLRDIGLMRPEPQDRITQAITICYGCATQSLLQSYYLTPAKEEVAFLLLEETFKRMKDDIANANSRLAILLIPTKLQIESEMEADLVQSAQILDLEIYDAIMNDQRVYDKVMELGLNLGIEMIDVLPAFNAYHQQHEDEPLFFNKDWHLTPLGHRVLAMQIYQYLMDHQVSD